VLDARLGFSFVKLVVDWRGPLADAEGEEEVHVVSVPGFASYS